MLSLQGFVEYRSCMGRQATAPVSKLEYDKITSEIRQNFQLPRYG